MKWRALLYILIDTVSGSVKSSIFLKLRRELLYQVCIYVQTQTCTLRLSQPLALKLPLVVVILLLKFFVLCHGVEKMNRDYFGLLNHSLCSLMASNS